ncbi:mobilization protein [Campylobacter helveticus]|uniref:mobilization protein n=1 Tax=Campylobacter helveticus TaxID=28898 RepID=UPI001111A5A6|nr:mobilization protein [Campylobacter helveticus]TNB54137.1 mobilization protein [Campylobacter helveticus]
MKIGAVHCNPKIAPHLQHNDRTNSTSPNIHKERSHLNQCSKTAIQALREIDQLYKEAMEKQKGKKGKKTPKERSYHEFIYEINENTTMEQCEKLTQQIAELTGFTPIQVTIHKDEGHINEQGEFMPHYHAHAVFFTLDKNTGKQLARQQASLNPKNLSKIQDLAANTLQMQRGQKYFNIEEYKLSKQEKRPYKPQAPKKIQNQDDFKRFANAKREAEAELKKEAHKLTELGLELKNKEKVISTYEKELKTKKNAFLKEKQELESGHEQALTNLKSTYKRQYSVFKNIFTLGKHNQKVDENYNIAKNALLASKKEADKKLEQKNKELERKERELQESKEQTRLERQKNNELQLQINRLIEKNKELKQELKKAEKEILKHIDFNAEVEYLRRNSDYNPKLSDIQQQAINNELTRRIQANEKEQQRSQPKGYTLYR